MDQLKVCKGCKESKAVNLFSKDKSRKDGLHSLCKKCNSHTNKVWRESNREKIKEYRIKNKDYFENKIKEYRKENKQLIKKMFKNWSIKNKDRINAKVAKRRSKKLNATPPWLTAAQLEEMVDIYKQAKELEQIFFNRKFHVDHIVPLQGKDVCGLHVPWNLQILTAEENIKKGNRI